MAKKFDYKKMENRKGAVYLFGYASGNLYNGNRSYAPAVCGGVYSNGQPENRSHAD